ncbi:D-alanyl-D-alanine carboxypeptidase family protein [Stappia sp. ES.058]|uniref:D-alanyl-D-alanine carboxypeptidase family protein n=1 Tax=Stappia sp. ES.058 TaxID=1881061 RepID=UPI00087C385B|nr:D-alanyl-D-alanine carboxypeptidase family protein [Stappia sp. ES.058]SDU40862.1 D-alanyl-D-alanine carboxypeptidase [Stappia sp. ES.058]
MLRSVLAALSTPARPARRLVLYVALAMLALPAPVARADIGAWIVVDMDSGAVLDQKQARRQWYPASITKLMTAYLAFKAIREGRATLQSVVTISANAYAEPPSKMGFKPGTRISLESALKIVIVKSANDVAVAVAEAIGGSEPAFIAQMNAEARRLGMSATRFVNPHGLPDNRQVSSARDLAVLARAVWREFPQYRPYFSLPGIRVGKKTLRSANREFLLRVQGANGMKTGYICNAGLNVVVSATRGGRTVMAVILGAASGVERAAKARALIDAGFKERGGRSVDQLAGVSAKPPADGYCKRNSRPKAEELLAAFGQKTRPSSVLSFARGDLNGGGIRRSIVAAPTPTAFGSVELLAVPKRADGKTDWAKVMDAVIGPRRLAYEAVTVSTAAPRAAVAPRILEGKPLPVPGTPKPVAKPLAAAAELVSVPDVAAPVAAQQAAKPGAIFRGEPLLIAPIPPQNPRP